MDAQSTPKARWNIGGQQPINYDIVAEMLIDVGVGQIRIDSIGYITGLPEDVTVEIWYGFQPGKAPKMEPDERVSLVKGGGWKMSRRTAVVMRLFTGTLGVSWA